MLVGNVEASDDQLRLGAFIFFRGSQPPPPTPFSVVFILFKKSSNETLRTHTYTQSVGGLGGNRFGIVLRNVEDGVTDAAIAEACEVSRTKQNKK